jgi:uncharacterized protein YjiS (DUF1127 family)
MSDCSQQAHRAPSAAPFPSQALPDSLAVPIFEKETAMTAFDHTSGSSRFAARPNTVARLVQVALNVFKAFKNRREFYRLGELSDAELADIGLTRADLHVAYGHPLGIDPTSALNVIVQRRAEDEEAAARSVC